jgi:hypothetical protein
MDMQSKDAGGGRGQGWPETSEQAIVTPGRGWSRDSRRVPAFAQHTHKKINKDPQVRGLAVQWRTVEKRKEEKKKEKKKRKEGKVRTGARKAGLAETLPDYRVV